LPRQALALPAPGALIADRGQVVLEAVVEEAVAALLAVEEQADDVVREAVVPHRQRAHRFRRRIDAQAHRAVQHLVVFDQGVVAFLEHDAGTAPAVRAWATWLPRSTRSGE
jgi:hypothetical protein